MLDELVCPAGARISFKCMKPPHLKIISEPKLTNATMLLALTGWMDGGSVSTGTVKQLLGWRSARDIARIQPDEFYIYNFPGDMETSALFRPNVKYVNGIVKQCEMPANTFYVDERANLVFFVGKEPNLRWQAFADCLFEVARRVGVTRIIFMGSFGGAVPHTREPRLYGSVSDEKLRPLLEEYGVRPSDYEGPGSFSSFLLSEAPRHSIEMLSLVAEIPGYLQGVNPLSIETISRRLARLLNQPIDLDAMREMSNTWENQVTAAVEKDPELAATIRKLEEQYDNDLIESEGG
jgi:proteasome assembly chaperone (PAC2) family protein